MWQQKIRLYMVFLRERSDCYSRNYYNNNEELLPRIPLIFKKIMCSNCWDELNFIKNVV